MEVLFSEEAWATRNTLMPLSASVENMRLLTPMTPTIESPATVITATSRMDDMPFIARPSGRLSLTMTVPRASGRKVLRMYMGILLTQAGYMVGGYTTFAPKLQSSTASW